MKPEDYGKWENPSQAILSPDGRWLAYTIRRVNRKNELKLKSLDSDSNKVFKRASGANFSNDNEWLAFRIKVSTKEREKLEKDNKPVYDKLGLHKLSDGKTTKFDKVKSFAFSEDGKYLVIQMNPVKGRDSKGSDLIVRNLKTDINTGFGNISSTLWNDEANLLAMTIDAEDQAGNGVQVYNPETGRLRTLASDKTLFKSIIWREDADDLAVLKEKKFEEDEDVYYEVISWRKLNSDEPEEKVLDPIEHDEFPEEMRLVDYAGLQWSEDGQTLFFGIKEWDNKPEDLLKGEEDERKGKKQPDENENEAEGEENKALRETLKDAADVEVWHAQDIEIMPRQKKTEDRDKKKSYLAAWWIADNHLVPLGSELTEEVRLFEKQKLALGTDNTPYETEKRFGPTLVDAYIIDTLSGERTKALERIKYLYDSSPDGRYLPYILDDHFWLYDTQESKSRNLTESLDTSFINKERNTLTDHANPYGSVTWTKDGTRLVLYDKFDLWLFAADASETKRLTMGKESKTVHRWVNLDPEEEEIDLEKPLYLSLYGNRTKKYGYAVMTTGETPETRIWTEKNISNLLKAEEADVYCYLEQDFDDSPDYWVSGKDLNETRQVTDTNLFQADYQWGHSELINYVNEHGQKLQGALFYPADYDPSRQYPMIVYIYEIRSNNVNYYTSPSERSAYNPTVWTHEGYFVFQPDIVYRKQNPGLSAKECVIPAVKKVLETGMIDPNGIGLVGHSWGGYQTAFLSTQTDLFATFVAGAPLTNMMSMSMSIYWNTGKTDAWIFHESQGRMDRPFWRDIDTYARNSAIFNIDQLRNPLLVTFGDEDGAVDWQQGIELYNAARLVQKPMVMLVYPGENHGLAKKENQVDYHYRILEWFGHYLKGDPAPEWITEGQTFLERQKEIRDWEKKSEKGKKD